MSIKPVDGSTKPLPQDRVLRMALIVIRLPLTLARLGYRGIRRLVGGRKTLEQLREDDQVRQSRARRTLRGLSPDHDGATKSGP